MKIKDCIKEIEKIIPKELSEDSDNTGLLCGNSERKITGMMICHDTLEEVIIESIEKKVNFILCFHPIIFSGIKSITGKNYAERAVLLALENKIAIYAMHTALDNYSKGVNYRISKEIGLSNIKILSPKEKQLQQLEVYVPAENLENVRTALFESGAGNIGNYKECSFSVNGEGTFRPLEGANPYIGKMGIREKTQEVLLSVIYEKYKKEQIISSMKKTHPYEEITYQIYSLENKNFHEGLGAYGELDKEIEESEFLSNIKRIFNLRVIRHSPFTGKKIKKVGVLGGSGAKYISKALSCGCDAYLTGDVKYHDFFLGENKMIIVDIGHFESEQFIVQQLFEIFSEKFSNFVVHKTNKNTNPINYFL